MKGTSAH